MLSALKKYDSGLKKQVEARLLEAANRVAADARGRFSDVDNRSAAGFRPRLRGFSRVVVEQRLRRKTGDRPDYGALQMTKALLPAMAENQEKVIEDLDRMLDELARRSDF